MRRFTEDGERLPKGVCVDKERGKFRATYKGWSIKCSTLEEATEKREELVKAKKAHPSYIARKMKG